MPVLFGKQFGWRHDRRLYTTGNRFKAGYGRNDGLAGADVALNQAHHRMRDFKVRKNFTHDAPLRGG